MLFCKIITKFIKRKKFSATYAAVYSTTTIHRENADILIVGGGPAGLSAAIRSKQLNPQLRIVVLEKGAEIGSHILSGCVMEPSGLEELFPNYHQKDYLSQIPLGVSVKRDSLKYLTKNHSFSLPLPSEMNNRGNRIISLSNFTKWLAVQAEALGVEIYTGISGSGLLFSPNNAHNDNSVGASVEDKERVVGVVTNDFGISKDGKLKENYANGMEIHAKVTMLAEGCHGSLSKGLINKFNLRKSSDPQTYAIGLKEVWEVESARHNEGEVLHTIGWPLPFDTYGGSFVYHAERNLIYIGLVVGLDYKNPYLNPYLEFQRFKHHPLIAPLLTNGRCVGYGARALNEGGYQAIPKLSVAGAILIGCSGGFLNVPKLKGSHLAMKSGIVAAHVFAPSITCSSIPPDNLFSFEENKKLGEKYEQAIRESSITKELKNVRNVRPSFRTPFGLYGGSVYAAIESLLLRGKEPWTFRITVPDYATLALASEASPIEYTKPDGKISFDIATSVSRSGTNHNEDQPTHLKLTDTSIPVAKNLPLYAGPEERYCPAGVYEFVHNGTNQEPFLQINAQNCIHCKTCDIKDPSQNITWTVPEGGDGPKYTEM